MNKTIMGRHIYALGGNEKAADLSGVNTKKVAFWVFVNMGVLNNGISLIGLGVDWQQGIKGLVLLAAVAFDIYNKKKVTFLK